MADKNQDKTVVITDPKPLNKYLKSDVKEMKKIFNQSFNDTWKSGVSFPTDDVITAISDGKIVGFTFIHNEPPYKFKGGSVGYYMYNLCVATECRRNGVGTALVQAVQKAYTIVHLHKLQKNNIHPWLTKLGFVAREMWRGELLEYTSPSYMAPKQYAGVGLNAPTSKFDAIEGVMYMH